MRQEKRYASYAYRRNFPSSYPSHREIKGLKFSDTVYTENSFFSTTSKNNTHLPQVNNNSGNTVPTNNSVV